MAEIQFDTNSSFTVFVLCSELLIFEIKVDYFCLQNKHSIINAIGVPIKTIITKETNISTKQVEIVLELISLTTHSSQHSGHSVQQSFE